MPFPAGQGYGGAGEIGYRRVICRAGGGTSRPGGPEERVYQLVGGEGSLIVGDGNDQGHVVGDVGGPFRHPGAAQTPLHVGGGHLVAGGNGHRIHPVSVAGRGADDEQGLVPFPLRIIGYR